MVQHSGHFPVLPSITLRLFSTLRFSEGFGAYLVSYTSIVHCMCSKSGQSRQPFLLSKCPSLIVHATFIIPPTSLVLSVAITLYLDCVIKSVMMIIIMCATFVCSLCSCVNLAANLKRTLGHPQLIIFMASSSFVLSLGTRLGRSVASFP